MQEYYIQVFKDRNCSGFFYSGESDNQGPMISARKHAVSVPGFGVGTVVHSLMQQYQPYGFNVFPA